MRRLLAGLGLSVLAMMGGAIEPAPLPRPFEPQDFPIGVWLQQPHHAQRYKDLGINLYVGLWQGPTADQLAALKKARMPVICTQNDVGLGDPNRDIIVGWLQQDEPDNAQPLVDKFTFARLGWGAPVDPVEMQKRYAELKRNDSGRPVYLNLGKGVAWDAWRGRGSRTNHPEDYPYYAKAGDIVSFDIYPAAETDPALAGRLEFVAQGVRRLREWAGPGKPVWAAIGASRVSNPDAAVDPQAIRSQVWMSIIAGARGILYFVHQLKPRLVEATWFDNPPLAEAVRGINARIRGLTTVILGPETNDLRSVGLQDGQGRSLPAEQIAVTTRRTSCAAYVFASSLSGRPMRAHFRLAPVPGVSAVVLDEDRTLPIGKEGFADDFSPYAVHLYVIPSAGCAAPGLATGRQ